jgi:hypothetical protein
LDTTGATALFAIVSGSAVSHPTIIDSKSDTWNTDIDWNGGHISVFSCNPSSVGSGHTVTIQVASGCNVIFIAFSGSSKTLDGVSTPGSTGNWNGATVNAGSLTPSTANDLCFAVAWWNVGAGTSDTVDSGFTKTAALGTNPGLGLAYKIKSSDSTAENPGWIHAAGADGMVIQAQYHP